MGLAQYLNLARRWLWLLALSAFLGGSAVYLVRSNQADEYQTQVTISVGTFIEAPNPEFSELQTGAELAQTYAVLAKTYDVLEAAVEAGEFPITPKDLGKIVEARVVPDTSLLTLKVTYPDPVLVADMANELAKQLILNSPSNLTPEQQNQIDLQIAEIERLNQELEQARSQLSMIDAELLTATDPDQIESLREQRNIIVNQINQASANIAQFSNTISTLQRRVNSLDIVERARIPTSPIGTSPILSAFLGAIVSAGLAAGIVLALEYLDDSVHSAEEATYMFSLPTLASITRFGKPTDSYRQRLITYHDPASTASEEYRVLRTNLLFSPNGNWSKGAYIITSPGPNEGKSVTTANLAVTMATAGLRVLLIDADLRRPRQHEIFNLDNQIGLSTLLFANLSEAPSSEPIPQDLKALLKETDIPGLRIITSGFLPSNPTEALGSTVMRRWANEFSSAKNVDVVIYDTPPTLVVADCSALAAAIKVPVLLVVEAGKTRRSAALKSIEQFNSLEIQIKGVVLNRVNPRDRGYGSYSYYYYGHYGDQEPRSPAAMRDKQH